MIIMLTMRVMVIRAIWTVYSNALIICNSFLRRNTMKVDDGVKKPSEGNILTRDTGSIAEIDRIPYHRPVGDG
jgi:hypothetical protein